MAVVTAETARQLELTFFSRFDQAVRRLQRVRSPVDGRWVRVPDWTAIHREDPPLLPPRGRAAVVPYGTPIGVGVSPQNLTSVYHVNAKAGHGGSFALGALCFWPAATDPAESVPVRPATVKELTAILERAADTGQSGGALYVLAIAAPAGFDPAAVEAIAGSPSTRSFHSPHLAPCLVDLSSNTLTYNPADRRITQFLDLFAGELEEEAIRRVAQYIRQALLTRQSQSEAEVAAATKAPLQVVQRAFALLEAEGPYIVEQLRGLGRVISRRL
jgi:hypothetical protein